MWKVILGCHFDTGVAVFMGFILGNPHCAGELKTAFFSCGVNSASVLEFIHPDNHLWAGESPVEDCPFIISTELEHALGLQAILGLFWDTCND